MISVIVIFFNSEPFISKCVDSLKAQSDTDFQAVFVNDGSTDSSREILVRSLESAPFQHVIVDHKVNYGISVARNSGLDAATGDRICFVDSDDYVEKDHIREIRRVCDEKGTDLVLFGLNKVSQKSGDRTPHACTVGEGSMDLPDFLARVGFNVPGFYYVQMVFRKSLIDENRLRFFPGCSPGEDVEFVLKYLCFVDSIHSIPNLLYNYLIHDGNVTNRNPSHVNYHYWGITERLRNWISSHSEMPDSRKAIINMGIAKYYRRLFSNSWKYDAREFRTSNPNVRYVLRKSLQYPYLERRMRWLFIGLLAAPFLLKIVYRLKYIMVRR